MNTKKLFLNYAVATKDRASFAKKIEALKPWTWSAKRQAEHDAIVVRGLALRYGFKWGKYDSDKAVYSGLAIKSPGADVLKANEKMNDDYGAARKALADERRMFKERVVVKASLTDKLHKEGKHLAAYTDAQFKRIAELRKAYIAKQQ